MARMGYVEGLPGLSAEKEQNVCSRATIQTLPDCAAFSHRMIASSARTGSAEGSQDYNVDLEQLANLWELFPMLLESVV